MQAMNIATVKSSRFSCWGSSWRGKASRVFGLAPRRHRLCKGELLPDGLQRQNCSTPACCVRRNARPAPVVLLPVARLPKMTGRRLVASVASLLTLPLLPAE